MSDLPRPVVLLDIIEEHFEELDILWEQREGTVFAPDWYLADLAYLEERCAAHLNGLRLAGANAVEIVEPALTGPEPSAATAAAFTFLALADPDLDAKVLEAFESGSDEARDGIRLALRHMDGFDRLAKPVRTLAKEAAPPVRIAALDVIAFHRQPATSNLEALLGELDGDSLAGLHPALGRFGGGAWTVERLQAALKSGDPVRQRPALEASARCGLPGLRETCLAAATSRENPSPAAMEFLGVVGTAADVPILERAIGMPALAEAALAALGGLGYPETVGILAAAMDKPETSPAAGRAFVRMTGATGIDADEPLPPPEGLSEDDLDLWEDVVPPDPKKAGAWWKQNKSKFRAGERFQDGKPASPQALSELPLAARRDVYLGWRAADPKGAPDLELEARVLVQLR